jgi:hypothetical protein
MFEPEIADELRRGTCASCSSRTPQPCRGSSSTFRAGPRYRRRSGHSWTSPARWRGSRTGARADRRRCRRPLLARSAALRLFRQTTARTVQATVLVEVSRPLATWLSTKVSGVQPAARRGTSRICVIAARTSASSDHCEITAVINGPTCHPLTRPARRGRRHGGSFPCPWTSWRSLSRLWACHPRACLRACRLRSRASKPDYNPYVDMLARARACAPTPHGTARTACCCPSPATVCWWEREEWLDSPFVPAGRSRGESWFVIVSEESRSAWLKGAAPDERVARDSRTGRGTRTISMTLRLQVLRRDGFRCTYCGRAPPEVVLHGRGGRAATLPGTPTVSGQP